MNDKLTKYIEEVREPIKALSLKYKGEFDLGCGGSHVGVQRGVGGLGIHTIQVIEKALELNQSFDRRDIIETCLVHDLKHWKKFPLDKHQITAIRATKGLPWGEWRPKKKFRFTALILVADMWSAYINEKNIS